VCGVETFVWIGMVCGYGILLVVEQLLIVKQFSRAFYRLFTRYRYNIGGEIAVCGSECDPMQQRPK